MPPDYFITLRNAKRFFPPFVSLPALKGSCSKTLGEEQENHPSFVSGMELQHPFPEQCWPTPLPRAEAMALLAFPAPQAGTLLPQRVNIPAEPCPCSSKASVQRQPTQKLKMKQAPGWAEMRFVYCCHFIRGSLASCEVQRSGTTDPGEAALPLNVIHNNHGSIWRVTFQSI